MAEVTSYIQTGPRDLSDMAHNRSYLA